MGKYKTLSALKAALQSKMKDAMDEATQESFEDAQINARGFYTGGTPKLYKRTGQFGNSPSVIYPGGSGDSLRSYIYWNDEYEYNTGTYSTDKVFHEIEHGGSGIVGLPGTWERTKEDIENNIQTAFGKRFS